MINWSTSRINFGVPNLETNPIYYGIPGLRGLCCAALLHRWQALVSRARTCYPPCFLFVDHHEFPMFFPPYPCHSMSTCSFFWQIQILMEYLWLRLCQHNEEWTGIVICLSWERGGPSWPNLDSLPNQWEGWSLCLKMCQFRWLFSP